MSNFVALRGVVFPLFDIPPPVGARVNAKLLASGFRFHR